MGLGDAYLRHDLAADAAGLRHIGNGRSRRRLYHPGSFLAFLYRRLQGAQKTKPPRPLTLVGFKVPVSRSRLQAQEFDPSWLLSSDRESR